MKKFETQAIRVGQETIHNRAHSTPLYLTSSFTFESAEQSAAIFAGEETGDIYSRFSNPNSSELIHKLCTLENCEAGVTTASGMAAIYTCFAALLQKGDHLVASKNIFGNTLYIITQILPRMGVSYTLVDIDKPNDWKSAITPKTKILYLETPSNPTLKIADMTALGELCKNHYVHFMVDNCFATPYLQNPSNYGADLVVHSATKYLDGQGRVLGGAILGSENLVAQCYDFIRRTGASLSPFNAWILSKSIETLAIRMDRHCSNAHTLARWLESQPEIKKVHYPFLPSHPQYALAQKQMKAGGGLVGFELKGDLAQGRRFLNHLEIHSLTANLGDTRSIATHPASTTHSKLTESELASAGISPSFIRISVGLENITDIIADVEQAIKAC